MTFPSFSVSISFAPLGLGYWGKNNFTLLDRLWMNETGLTWLALFLTITT